MNKLFIQPEELQENERSKEGSKNVERIDCGNKHSKTSRIQIGRERNATCQLLRSSKNVKTEQYVHSKDSLTKPSHLQSIVTSVEKSSKSNHPTATDYKSFFAD